MADIVLTIDDLNKLFQNLVLDILGYEQSGAPLTYSDEAFYAVRVGWPSDGAPAWKITEDVIILRIQEIADDYNISRDLEIVDVASPPGLIQRTSYTRVMELFLVAYGPNSFNNMQIIRDKIHYMDARDTLTAVNMYMIPDQRLPKRVPELFSGKWWERVDMTLRFNELVIREVEIPYVESVDIEVLNGVYTEEITVSR